MPTSHVKFHGVQDVSFGRLPSFNICFLFLLPLQALGCAGASRPRGLSLGFLHVDGSFLLADGGNVTTCIMNAASTYHVESCASFFDMAVLHALHSQASLAKADLFKSSITSIRLPRLKKCPNSFPRVRPYSPSPSSPAQQTPIPEKRRNKHLKIHDTPCPH